jgi:hypothetical protein
MIDVQQRECFYCRDRLGPKCDIDHFVPWARWPNDAVENLVVAHDRCNRSKSDYVASLDHVQASVERVALEATDLAASAHKCGWPSDRHRSLSLARSCYGHLPDDTPLWRSPNDFTRFAVKDLDPAWFEI